MRTVWLLAPVLAPVLASVFGFSCASDCAAQAPASKPIHCSVQKPSPASAADTLFYSGDFAGAEKAYTVLLATSANAANYAGLIRSQLEQDKLAEALSSAEKAQTALPGQPAEAQSLLGDVDLRAGRIPEALEAYKKALELDQCSGRGHFGLGRVAELNSAHATAAREFNFAHKLNPGDAEIAAAFFNSLQEQPRLAGLQGLLTDKASLTPGAREQIETQVAILSQHKSCVAVEAGPDTKQLELMPVLINGKRARSWGLRTRLNDTTTPLLELDTSVAGIVLNESDAQKSGVKPLLALSTPPVAPYTGFLDRVQIGNLNYRDCPVRVVTDAALAGGNSLIGTDFFRDRLIHIDYVNSKLTLKELPARPGLAPSAVSDRVIAPEQKEWSSVYIAGPAVLLPTFINKAGPYLFLMDTGIYRSVISPVVTSSLLHPQNDATLNLQGTSGSIVKVLRREGGADVNKTSVADAGGRLLPVTTPFKIPVLHFTNNEYPDNSSISFDLSATSHQAGVEVSGLLGFGVLHSYYLDIDYRDGLARVLFDQNRTYDTRSVEGYH